MYLLRELSIRCSMCSIFPAKRIYIKSCYASYYQLSIKCQKVCTSPAEKNQLRRCCCLINAKTKRKCCFRFIPSHHWHYLDWTIVLSDSSSSQAVAPSVIFKYSNINVQSCFLTAAAASSLSTLINSSKQTNKQLLDLLLTIYDTYSIMYIF